MLTQLSRVLREGTSTTASIDVPLNIKDTVEQVLIQLDLPTAVYEDPRTLIKMSLYVLDGGVWRLETSATKEGGRYIDDDGIINPPPTLAVNAAYIAGKTVRGEISVDSRRRVGLTIETLLK